MRKEKKGRAAMDSLYQEKKLNTGVFPLIPINERRLHKYPQWEIKQY